MSIFFLWKMNRRLKYQLEKLNSASFKAVTQEGAILTHSNVPTLYFNSHQVTVFSVVCSVNYLTTFRAIKRHYPLQMTITIASVCPGHSKNFCDPHLERFYLAEVNPHMDWMKVIRFLSITVDSFNRRGGFSYNECLIVCRVDTSAY